MITSADFNGITDCGGSNLRGSIPQHVCRTMLPVGPTCMLQRSIINVQRADHSAIITALWSISAIARLHMYNAATRSCHSCHIAN